MPRALRSLTASSNLLAGTLMSRLPDFVVSPWVEDVWTKPRYLNATCVAPANASENVPLRTFTLICPVLITLGPMEGAPVDPAPMPMSAGDGRGKVIGAKKAPCWEVSADP